MGKHSKGIRFWGLVEKEKGKGKRLCVKGNKTKITLHKASRNKQAPGSTRGILNELFCFCLILVHVLISLFHLCSTFAELLIMISSSAGMEVVSGTGRVCFCY